jgi:hypothetical protein
LRPETGAFFDAVMPPAIAGGMTKKIRIRFCVTEITGIAVIRTGSGSGAGGTGVCRSSERNYKNSTLYNPLYWLYDSIFKIGQDV